MSEEVRQKGGEGREERDREDGGSEGGRERSEAGKGRTEGDMNREGGERNTGNEMREGEEGKKMRKIGGCTLWFSHLIIWRVD